MDLTTELDLNNNRDSEHKQNSQKKGPILEMTNINKEK